MSYDVWLNINTGGGNMASVIDIGNYTSNVSGMWRKALPPDGIAGLHGKRCSDVAQALTDAVAQMVSHASEYRAMEPTSGWGDYEGALDYLQRLAIAANEHPNCVIEVSR